MAQIKRRQFLIKKNLQIKFALSSFLLILLSTACVWFLMQTVVRQTSYYAWHASLFVTRSYMVIWAFIVADAIAAFAITLFFSHYIAGPIYRVEKAMNALLSDEKLAGITLRKNDSLQDTAEILNQVIGRWNEMKDELKQLKGKK